MKEKKTPKKEEEEEEKESEWSNETNPNKKSMKSSEMKEEKGRNKYGWHGRWLGTLAVQLATNDSIRFVLFSSFA